jgi:lysozyme
MENNNNKDGMTMTEGDHTHNIRILLQQEFINFIKRKEGFVETPEPCPSGHQTIGYGHKLHKLELELSILGLRRISEEKATNLLEKDLQAIYYQIKRVCPSIEELSINRVQAIMSLVYNWGIGNFAKSNLCKCISEGNHIQAAEEFLNINKSNGKVLRGLTIRRIEESQIYQGYIQLNSNVH